MSTKSEFPLKGKRMLRSVWSMIGIAAAKKALEENKHSAPWFALASALVDAEHAKLHAEMSINLLREAAKAGFDINKSISLSVGTKGNETIGEITMSDLGDDTSEDE